MRYHPGCYRRDDARVVEVYEHAPTFDLRALGAWDALSTEVDRLYLRLTTHDGVKANVTAGEQPYPDFDTMQRHVKNTWSITVTADNSQHPVWGVAQNARFRAVHDFYGHVMAGNGFDLDGEWGAYEAQRGYLNNPRALWPLFVEVYAQAAVAVTRGEFPVQKVFLA